MAIVIIFDLSDADDVLTRLKSYPEYPTIDTVALLDLIFWQYRPAILFGEHDDVEAVIQMCVETISFAGDKNPAMFENMKNDIAELITCMFELLDQHHVDSLLKASFYYTGIVGQWGDAYGIKYSKQRSAN